MTLVRQCNDLLDRAEIRITELSASITRGGTARYTPESLFSLDDEDAEPPRLMPKAALPWDIRRRFYVDVCPGEEESTTAALRCSPTGSRNWCNMPYS